MLSITSSGNATSFDSPEHLPPSIATALGVGTTRAQSTLPHRIRADVGKAAS